MKTTMQNKIIAAVSLVCVLFLVSCRTQTGGTTALPSSPIEEFDLKMIEKVQAEALDIWKEEDKNLPIKPKPIVLIAPLFEDRFKGELCECLVESEHILQINLKSDSAECVGEPIGYQRFRLNRIKIETTEGRTLSFYTFAATKKDKDRDERLQTFYISEPTKTTKLPSEFRFKRKFNYDIPAFVVSTGVDYVFQRDMNDTFTGDTICFNKIISQQFNMVGGNKPLVFDITKSINTRGLILAHLR